MQWDLKCWFPKNCFIFSILRFEGHDTCDPSYKTDLRIKHAHFLMISFECFVFSCYKKIELSFFLEKRHMLHKHTVKFYVKTHYVKEKCKLITRTRDETLRRKSSGGITDGLNWLKRHHNFFKFVFTFFYLHIFFFICSMFFASKCCGMICI